jgi:O-antigen/teichoic acid export membrane protein
MMTMRKAIVTNALANWVGTIAQLVAVFLLTPVLVHKLGDRRYGVWALIDSVLAYMTLFDLGIGAAVVRYVARFEGLRDLRSINRVFTASLVLFAAGGIGAIGVTAVIIGPAWSLISVPADLRSEAWWMFALLALNLAIGLPMGVFAAVLDGLQLFPVKAAARTAFLVVRSAALAIVVTRGGGLVDVALTTTLLGLLEQFVLAIVAMRHLPGLAFSPRLVNRDTLWSIGSYSTGAFLIMIAGRVAYQTDSLVIATFLNAESITFFVLGARLVEQAKGLFRALTTVLTPMFSQREAVGDENAIRMAIVDGMRLLVWISVPVQVGLFVLGRPFLTLWQGGRLAALANPCLQILALPMVPVMAALVCGRMLYGVGRLGLFCWVSLGEAAANLALSLVLVRSLGIEGVAWGTTIPAVGGALTIIGHAVRIQGISFATVLRRSFLPPLPGGLLLCLFWCAAPIQRFATSWHGLIIAVLAGLVLYALIAIPIELGPDRLDLVSRVRGVSRRRAGMVRLGSHCGSGSGTAEPVDCRGA